jgi:hypothetical protein
MAPLVDNASFRSELPKFCAGSDSGTPAAFGLAEYDSRALTTRGVHHALLMLANTLATVSLIGLLVIVCSLFIGARSAASGESVRRKP